MAKRAGVPSGEVRKLVDVVLKGLHGDLGTEVEDLDTRVDVENGGVNEVQKEEWRSISTLDERIDEVLGGGIPTGYVTEITGERYIWHLLSYSEQY